MIVEELVTKLGLEVDSTALATLEKFRSAVVGGLSTMGIAAVGVGAAFVGMVHAVAAAGDEAVNTAEKLGITAKSVQELKYAAALSDVPFESLVTGLKFLSKNAAEAASGSAEAMKSFAGISLKNSNGHLKTADELLFDVTERFKGVKDPIQQTNLAMKLFGRSGIDMIPMLKQGSKGLKEFIADAHEMGVVLDEETLEASDKFDRQLKRLKASFVGLRNAFAGPFVKDFADGMESTANAVRKARGFFVSLSLAFRDAGDRMGGLVRGFRTGAAAFSEWFSDTTLGKMLDQLKGFKVLEAALIGLGVIFVAVAAQAIGAWIAAAAPFVLLATLIGLIVDDIYNFIKGNDSLIGRLRKWGEAIGNPEEHPLIRLLRTATALLFDLTDPKHWARFKNAAGDAVDFISEKVRVALGGKKFTTTNPNAFGRLVPEDYAPTTPEQGGVFGQGGLLDTFGFKRSQNVAPAPEMTPFTGPQGIHLSPPGYQGYKPGNWTNNITINGSGLNEEQLKTAVEGALNDSYSKAFAGTSGGDQ